jgi:spore maturation protein CgeB
MTRFAFFYPSVISDWNNGNAHFLRGLMRALQARGHDVVCYEQADNWSLTNLLRVAPTAVADFVAQFPDLRFERYELGAGLATWIYEQLAGADVAIVHEWNPAEVIGLIGRLSAQRGVTALFHDTHYRVVLNQDYRASLGLDRYAAILAYSPSVAQRYRDLGYGRVHVLHEAADVTVFAPRPVPKATDVVFVGNYGDGDRSDELEDYIFGVRPKLPELRYAVYGVRYPEAVVARLNNGLDISYGGWLPNVRVAAIYSCLVSLPWSDTDRLFEAGRDYAVAHSPAEMFELLEWLSDDDAARAQFGAHGLQAIQARHTCADRADQLLGLL